MWVPECCIHVYVYTPSCVALLLTPSRHLPPRRLHGEDRRLRSGHRQNQVERQREDEAAHREHTVDGRAAVGGAGVGGAGVCRAGLEWLSKAR